VLNTMLSSEGHDVRTASEGVSMAKKALPSGPARLALASAVVAAALLSGTPVLAQTGGSLSGTWSIDREASAFPREVGFGADFLPSPRGDGGPRGGRGGGNVPPALRPQGESYDSAQRRDMLTGEIRTPASRLTVVDAADTVTITDENGRSRSFHPDGRAETLQIGAVPVLTVARREAGTLVVLYSVADLRQIRYTYLRLDSPARLVVDAQFLERGQGDSVRRVYTPADQNTASRATGAASSADGPGGVPAVPGAPPAVMPRAGSEFAGLTRLGIVVEELGTQALGCGLTVSALESAASKPFMDAGLRVARNSDEDTYVHVTVMTSTLPSGMCISRYDWSIYSTTEATLSYQRTPLLAQVVLAHKGGLSGSLPATHAADVMKSMSDGLAQVATIIRNANR